MKNRLGWLRENYIMIIGVLLFMINLYASYYNHIETPLGYPSLYSGQGLILLMLCYLMWKSNKK